MPNAFSMTLSHNNAEILVYMYVDMAVVIGQWLNIKIIFVEVENHLT